jgi:hypothetical protein
MHTHICHIQRPTVCTIHTHTHTHAGGDDEKGGDSLYADPTHDEMRALKETELLFKSSLMQLQVCHTYTHICVYTYTHTFVYMYICIHVSNTNIHI